MLMIPYYSIHAIWCTTYSNDLSSLSVLVAKIHSYQLQATDIQWSGTPHHKLLQTKQNSCSWPCLGTSTKRDDAANIPDSSKSSCKKILFAGWSSWHFWAETQKYIENVSCRSDIGCIYLHHSIWTCSIAVLMAFTQDFVTYRLSCNVIHSLPPGNISHSHSFIKRSWFHTPSLGQSQHDRANGRMAIFVKGYIYSTAITFQTPHRLKLLIKFLSAFHIHTIIFISD
jgi:hypothetical protein